MELSARPEPSRRAPLEFSHSLANARDLRKRFLALLETRISPGVYPELAEGVRNDNVPLCAFARDIPRPTGARSAPYETLRVRSLW